MAWTQGTDGWEYSGPGKNGVEMRRRPDGRGGYIVEYTPGRNWLGHRTWRRAGTDPNGGVKAAVAGSSTTSNPVTSTGGNNKMDFDTTTGVYSNDPRWKRFAKDHWEDILKGATTAAAVYLQWQNSGEDRESREREGDANRALQLGMSKEELEYRRGKDANDLASRQARTSALMPTMNALMGRYSGSALADGVTPGIRGGHTPGLNLGAITASLQGRPTAQNPGGIPSPQAAGPRPSMPIPAPQAPPAPTRNPNIGNIPPTALPGWERPWRPPTTPRPPGPGNEGIELYRPAEEDDASLSQSERLRRLMSSLGVR